MAYPLTKFVFEVGPCRNNDVGDYFQDAEGVWHIRSFPMKNHLHEQLIFVHEFIELLLVEHRGISQDAIDAYDALHNLESNNLILADPALNLDCPYRDEHKTALEIEKIMAIELDIDYAEYTEVISNA